MALQFLLARLTYGRALDVSAIVGPALADAVTVPQMIIAKRTATALIRFFIVKSPHETERSPRINQFVPISARAETGYGHLRAILAPNDDSGSQGSIDPG